jgi:hypothetical protein
MAEPPGSALEKRNCRNFLYSRESWTLLKMHPDGGAFLMGVKSNNYGADEYYQEE